MYLSSHDGFNPFLFLHVCTACLNYWCGVRVWISHILVPFLCPFPSFSLTPTPSLALPPHWERSVSLLPITWKPLLWVPLAELWWLPPHPEVMSVSLVILTLGKSQGTHRASSSEQVCALARWPFICRACSSSSSIPCILYHNLWRYSWEKTSRTASDGDQVRG